MANHWECGCLQRPRVGLAGRLSDGHAVNRAGTTRIISGHFSSRHARGLANVSGVGGVVVGLDAGRTFGLERGHRPGWSTRYGSLPCRPVGRRGFIRMDAHTCIPAFRSRVLLHGDQLGHDEPSHAIGNPGDVAIDRP